MIEQQAVEDYILSMPTVRREYPFGEQTAVFGVEGDAPIAERMFALLAEGSMPVRVSLKCDPQLSQLLRERYESVMPGEKLNKKHWNTVILTGQLSWEEVQDLIRLAYNLVAGA